MVNLNVFRSGEMAKHRPHRLGSRQEPRLLVKSGQLLGGTSRLVSRACIRGLISGSLAGSTEGLQLTTCLPEVFEVMANEGIEDPSYMFVST